MTQFYILRGEGIECEKEALRCFKHPKWNLDVKEISVRELLLDVPHFFANSKKGDWVFLPGGFSFADHFGSGRLLSYQLRQVNFFERLIERGLHAWGGCNGFQVLVQAGLFGQDVKLEANELQGRRLGFINRWVDCEGLGPVKGIFQFPVRHGEGRLVRKGPLFEKNVQAFLAYNDEYFSNGSVENIAGLVAQHGDSKIWGLMPHMEIALRPIDEPEYRGPEFIEEFREHAWEWKGSGTLLIPQILEISSS